MAYSPAVERYRALVEKYFPPELVDKALYVIEHESGGNPSIPGDGGRAVGLFQIHHGGSIAGRPSKEQLLDPEFNIRYAAQQLGAANNRWSDWGEGTENMAPFDPSTGKGRFGALGNAPYQGEGSGSTSYSTPPAAAGGGGGGSTSYKPTGAGGGGSSPVDEHYAELLDRRRQAYKAWISSLESGAYQDAYSSPAYQAFVDATDEVESYEAKYGKYGQGSDTQQGFENRIALGDYEGRQADRAFNQWQKKTDIAYETAGGQIKEAYDRNAARAKALNDMENSNAPSLMPHPETTTYLAPRFDDALAKWKKKMGVGDQPDLASAHDGTWDGQADPRPEFVDPNAKYGGDGTPFAGNPMEKPRVDRTRLPGPIGGVKIDLGPGTRAPGAPGGPVAPGSAFGQSLNQLSAPPIAQDFTTPPVLPRKKLASGARRISPSRWFARGTMNDEGGPAVVGEGGQPEFINVPGMGMVQVNQPTQIDLPEGADVIPANEMYQYSKLKQLAAMPPKGSTPEEIQERRNDPDLERKVLESLKKALAGNYAVDPPMTPVLEPGVPDLWGEFRGLTGIPAYGQPQGGQ